MAKARPAVTEPTKATVAEERPPARTADDVETAGEPGPRLRSVDVRTAALAVLAALGIVFLLRSAREVFIPLALGLLVSYALDPLVSRLARLVGRALAAGLVVASVTAGLGGLVYGLQDDALAIVDELPEAAAKLRSVLRRGRSESALGKVQEAVSEIEKTASAATGPGSPPPSAAPRLDLRGYVMWGSLGLVGMLAQIVMFVFLVFFLLLTGDLYKRKLVRIAGPSIARRKRTVEVCDEIGAQMRRFLLVEVLTAAGVGVATWLALWWLGVENAGVWGLAAGALNSIPYFGPVLVAAGLAVVAFLQFGSVRMTLSVVAVALAITSIEGWLLRPALLGRAARMNHLAVFVGLLFWGWVWGVVGVLLAVPMMTMLKAVCDRVDILQPVGDLLGE